MNEEALKQNCMALHYVHYKDNVTMEYLINMNSVFSLTLSFSNYSLLQ